MRFTCAPFYSISDFANPSHTSNWPLTRALPAHSACSYPECLPPKPNASTPPDSKYFHQMPASRTRMKARGWYIFCSTGFSRNQYKYYVFSKRQMCEFSDSVVSQESQISYGCYVLSNRIRTRSLPTFTAKQSRLPQLLIHFYSESLFWMSFMMFLILQPSLSRFEGIDRTLWLKLSSFQPYRASGLDYFTVQSRVCGSRSRSPKTNWLYQLSRKPQSLKTNIDAIVISK